MVNDAHMPRLGVEELLEAVNMIWGSTKPLFSDDARWLAVREFTKTHYLQTPPLWHYLLLSSCEVALERTI